MQSLFILQIGHIAAGMRITQGASVIAGFTVTEMVISKHYKACFIELADHMQIAA